MLGFREELSTESRASMRGAGRVSGESRIRIARLNARQRGVQSRLVVVPEKDSVLSDGWDVSDAFGDHAFTLTVDELADVLAYGLASVVHPTGARWSPDPSTMHIEPADDVERAYLREMARQQTARTARSGRGGRRGRGRRAEQVRPVAEVSNEPREPWTDVRPGYVSKRERRRRNAAARVSA